MKKATLGPPDSKWMVAEFFPAEAGLQALFREACASGRALAGFEFRVGFTDHVNRSFAFHDLAISVTAFCGGE